jgi:hypothetical protein
VIVDKREWSYDASVNGFIRKLSEQFDFNVQYVHDNPMVSGEYDLIYQCFWGERLYRKFHFDPERLLKGLSSHRWEDDALYGPCLTAVDVVKQYLSDAATVMCTSFRLYEAIKDLHPGALHVPNGFDTQSFFDAGRRGGSLRIGWAGNPADSVKGVNEYLVPACSGRFELKTATNLRHSQMNDFYNSIDVLAIASKHEGEPLTLLEGMAAGCFPVMPDIGLARELIDSGRNGLIVSRSVSAFRDAFNWCAANLDYIRRRGASNAKKMQFERNWGKCAEGYRDAFLDTLRRANAPRFRNDDVSGDTDLNSFKEFCDIFRKWGLVQTHGITLHGKTTTELLGQEGDLEGVEYAGHKTISKLPNEVIRELSRTVHFETRSDIISLLNQSPDHIALHGLYHTDYSTMSAQQQYDDIREGIEALSRLFPKKLLKYFIAPFNRTNMETYAVCMDFGLTVLASDGIHLEERIEDIPFIAGAWYRYHHHRFYKQSPFRYRRLSFSLLDECLMRIANAMDTASRGPW